MVAIWDRGGALFISSSFFTYTIQHLLHATPARIQPHRLALKTVVRKEGFKSLFSGITPTLMKVVPAVAIGMTTTKELLGYSKRNWE